MGRPLLETKAVGQVKQVKVFGIMALVDDNETKTNWKVVVRVEASLTLTLAAWIIVTSQHATKIIDRPKSATNIGAVSQPESNTRNDAWEKAAIGTSIDGTGAVAVRRHACFIQYRNTRNGT
ncbi:hypothetical protein APHAL10511_000323 [Amanita phalloides]|nr:hypothetical protein APHAL10511_000323 [Amanita phalloides]